MRLTQEERHSIIKCLRRGNPVCLVAKVFGVNRKTIRYWGKRDARTSLKDKPRNKKRKIAFEVELAILFMRVMFKWGTARIQQGLVALPAFMQKEMKECPQGVNLSRQSINKVLCKHHVNGFNREQKAWKFFRAKEPNELWQLDLKGPFTVQGKKWYFLLCVDDYSRYIITAEQFDHCPNIQEIFAAIKPFMQEYHPRNVLTDNNPFKQEWVDLLAQQKINALFAHPYYPQDKGKVERAIRNLAEEFVNLLLKFPHWLAGKIKEWVKWYNNKCYHRGIKNYPAQLFFNGKLNT
ncbi:MAG: DDE-type integrase/transposase/recombinase [Candidatus Diapherotrites archaeon]